MPGQMRRPACAARYDELRKMTPPPESVNGVHNPEFDAYYAERAAALSAAMADPEGLAWLQSLEDEVSPSSSASTSGRDSRPDVVELNQPEHVLGPEYEVIHGLPWLEQDDAKAHGVDTLGLARPVGADDKDLYRSGTTSAGQFLAGTSTRQSPSANAPRVTGLGDRKALWVEACRQAGATRDETSIILAQVMQETFTGTGHDQSKDGARDGSRNFSNLNLNEDMLYNYGGMGGIHQGSRSSLNDDDKMVDVVKAALNVMRKYGVDRYLHFTRGGRSGFNRPGEDAKAFADAIREVAQELAADDQASTDDARYAHNIRHI